MNHYGACVSYTTAWKYLKQLTQEARYLEVVREGHWVYDNLNYLLSIRHEREGRYTLLYIILTGHQYCGQIIWGREGGCMVAAKDLG